MPFICELSGDVLSEDAVVTPSGHVCRKRLLLSKLAENGGVDPFQADIPLTEDQLIVLATSSKIVPPRTQVTSLPAVLHQLQTEYDALVLELFDTRRALQETRKELSQALYQNDAAVRVLARISQERDAARDALQRWQAQAPGDERVAAAAPIASSAQEEPAAKKRRVEEESTALPLTNDIPQADAQLMIDTWDMLHKGRKQKQKEAAAQAPSPDTLQEYVETETKSWHKTSCKKITAMHKHGKYIVTAGKDKQVIVYDCEQQQVAQTLSCSKPATSVHSNDNYVVAGTPGSVLVFGMDGSSIGSLELENKPNMVDVCCHPDGTHVIAATDAGSIVVGRMANDSVTLVSLFAPQTETKLTCGALHPDGLIYLAGTGTGPVQIWDFRSKTLAGTLGDDESGAVVDMDVSNNGYHVAVAYASGKVLVWDLRKQKILATLNDDDKDALKSVAAVAFDESGKYLAYAGSGGTRITTVKKWGVTASLVTKLATGVVWGGDNWMATCSNKSRSIAFYGPKKE